MTDPDSGGDLSARERAKVALGLPDPLNLSTSDLMDAAIRGPLYVPIKLDSTSASQQLRRLRVYDGKRDTFCPECRQPSTWTHVPDAESKARARQDQIAGMALPSTSFRGTPPAIEETSWMDDFTLTLQCGRSEHHRAKHHFSVVPTGTKGQAKLDPRQFPIHLVKIGQWPSLTDFQLGDLSEIEEGMSPKQRTEFVRAINCAAHGFSVAACVYLRRVFEDVIHDARTRYLSQHQLQTWPEFDAAHTDGRIRLLRGFLPEFMTEHPHLYSVLSIGVHELTEDQCAKELPVLRQAIELIMHDRVTDARRKRQRDAVSKLLAQSVDEHRNSK